jgi:hypothetical protein
MTFEQFKQSVDKLLQEHYFININDAGIEDTSLFNSFKNNETPEDYVNWFAEKYDLTRYSSNAYGF